MARGTVVGVAHEVPCATSVQESPEVHLCNVCKSYQYRYDAKYASADAYFASHLSMVLAACCKRPLVDVHGNERDKSEHTCASCRRYVHTNIVCDHVLTPEEGVYFCSVLCQDVFSPLGDKASTSDGTSDDSDDHAGGSEAGSRGGGDDDDTQQEQPTERDKEQPPPGPQCSSADDLPGTPTSEGDGEGDVGTGLALTSTLDHPPQEGMQLAARAPAMTAEGQVSLGSTERGDACTHKSSTDANEQPRSLSAARPIVGMRVYWPWLAGKSHMGLVYAVREVDSVKHVSVAFDDCTFGEWALGSEFESAWGRGGSGWHFSTAPSSFPFLLSTCTHTSL